ncbi:transposase [Streptomyces sp. 3MP-14]|uniref:Transposase n=1 Tax=Streptomyces mimosae TaxID=2586635 RepID=A0A5N6AC72_9ACTN|nr:MULTISPECIES: transposase [Streptomyces]KAB8166417.1 transposase [Streptomyces mimosae]KAB8174210.1 transposase [Streptomyces sp. 3MP-14]
MRAGGDIAIDLRIPTPRRYDLTADRIRARNRRRVQVLKCLPALERACRYSTSETALVLLTKYPTPAAPRRTGRNHLANCLKNRKIRNLENVPATAIEAVEARYTTIPRKKLAAAMGSMTVRKAMAVDEQSANIDSLVRGRSRKHRHAEVTTSLPGIGPALGTEFVGLTGGDMSLFTTDDRLAGVADPAPVPMESGRVTGTLDRPRHDSCRLLRLLWLSPKSTARPRPVSRTFHDREGVEDKGLRQAISALSRRRLNVV